MHENNPIHTPSLVLSIVGLVLCYFWPVTFVTCIIALYQIKQIKKTSGEYNTTAAKVISVLGLVFAGIWAALSLLWFTYLFFTIFQDYSAMLANR